MTMFSFSSAFISVHRRRNFVRAARRIATGTAVAVTIWFLTAGIVLTEGSLRVPRRIATPHLGTPVAIDAADGAKLKATLIPGTSGRCVLLLHGIGDSRSGALGFARMFTAQHDTVLAPDSRAHGESGGELVTFGVREQDDVRRWASWLRQRHACTRVLGLGESLGGSVLIMAAASQPPPFDAIVAECPYGDLPLIAEYRVHKLAGALAKPLVWSARLYALLRYQLDLSRTSAIQAARQLNTPLLLIHGLQDDRTPPGHSRSIFAAAKPGLAELWEVPNAGHTTASAHEPEAFRMRVLRHLR